MPAPSPPRRPRPPSFQPRFTLGIFYLAFFFLLYALLLVLPELLDVLANAPPGPEQERIAQQRVHAIARPRLAIAAVLAVLTTVAGAYYRVLPGMRER
jgi:hypothetical protein